MLCVPPAPLALTVSAVRFIAHLQSSWGSSNSDPVSGCTHPLFSVRAKTKPEVTNLNYQ